MPFSLGFWAAAGAGGGGGADAYELISTTTLSGTSTGVTFSGIPSTYRHLQIRMVSRTNEAGATYNNSGLIELNTDTTNGNYAGHYLQGNGSGVNSGALAFKVGSLRDLQTSLSTSNAFAEHLIDLPDYAQTTKYKTVRVLSGMINSDYGARGCSLTSLLWMNTAAVTSITLKPNSGSSWVSFSRFSLYGIKG
jgi:hypothetical protein